MDSTIEVQDLIIQQIKERDFIEDIQQSLSGLYEINPSPSYCRSLFIPLLQHASDNQEIESNEDVYSTIFADLYQYTLKKNFVKGHELFKECLLFTKDIIQIMEEGDSINGDKYGINLEETELETLLNYLTIAIQSCSSMVKIAKINPTINSLWRVLPKVLNCCKITPNLSSVKIIKASISICNNLIDKNLANVYSSGSETLLNGLLALLDGDDLPENIMDEIANAVSSTIQAYPNTKLYNPSAISVKTNSIASSMERKEFKSIRVKSILNISCLLIKNYTKTPWLNNLLSIANTEELEILKDKASLLLHFTEDMNFVSSQVDDMDIDQVTLQSQKQNFDPLIKFDSVDKELFAKLGPIIEELTHLKEGNMRYTVLLSKIKDISIFTNNTDISVMCQPFIKDVAEFVTRILTLDPGMGESVVLLFDLNIPQFMSTYLRYALPYAIIHTNSNDILLGISSSLDVTISDLCENNAHHILLALLMEENPKTKCFGYGRLQQILNTKSDVHRELASKNATKITTALSMNLGIPELKQQALKALEEMKNLFGMSSTSISDYLSQFIVGILAKITRFISEKSINSAYIHEPHALKALKEIMAVLQPNINDHALHLIKTFQAINKIDGMQTEALSLWKQFISLMDDKYIVSNLNGIIKGLLQILPLANHNVRVAVAMAIENVVSRKLSLSPSVSDLPILPDFEELRNLKASLEKALSTSIERNDKKSQMKSILQNLRSSDDVKVLFELQKLDLILTKNFTFLVNLAPVYSRLLYLIRKYSSHKEISKLSAICLGKLGAINPSLIDVKIIQDEMLLMYAFNDETENREFICSLISNYIFPAYNATSNGETHQYIQVAIQSLLKCAGFSVIPTMKKSRSHIYQRWLKLPPAIREFLMPFLQSSFESNWRGDTIHYPIFPQAINFLDWTQMWFCRMVSVTRGKAKSILEACIPIVLSKNVDISTFLIPYVVCYLVINGTADDVMHIKEEMLLILDTNAEYGANSSRGKINQQALQVVVSITEYSRKWLNNVNPGDRRFDSSVMRITNFLSLIPEKKMAIAAFNSGSYSQALMHFETYIKTNSPEGTIEPTILNYLRRIYTQTDDRTDLVALIETYSTFLGYDEEIIRSETAGRWQEAEVLYKNKINGNPSDLPSYTGYLNCLKRWGSYETVLYVADKVCAKTPKWTPYINSFRIDSAWRVEDWHTLEKAVELPVRKSPEALIGCILAKMRRNQSSEAACTIEEARNNLIENLNSNTTESYRKSYPTIFNLQLLQELEDAQNVWESPNPIKAIDKLQFKWKANYENITSKYQYKHNLLELRKAVFFDIRPEIHTATQASNLLLKIAKSSRKAGNLSAALDALLTAEKLSGKSFAYEKAKWYWASGYKEEALSLLNSAMPESSNKPALALLITKFHKSDPSFYTTVEIRSYYSLAMKSPVQTEKAFHSCASFYYNLYPRDSPLDENKLKILVYVARSSSKALQYGSKFYYSSMSRLVNVWFDIVMLDKTASTKYPRLTSKIKSHLKLVNEIMSQLLTHVPAFQLCNFLPRLISHLNIDDVEVAKCLMDIIGKVFERYPRSSIWLLVGALSSEAPFIADRMTQILAKVRNSTDDTNIPKYINQTDSLITALKTLSEYPVKDKVTELFLNGNSELAHIVELKDLDIYIPTERSLYPVLPDVIIKGTSEHKPFPDNLPTIRRIESKVLVMKSLQKPKRITIEGSDGRQYKFLVKGQDDLRKDARTMELNYAINSFLKKTPESRDNELYIRTYAVIPLGTTWGLIQWIDNIFPLKAIVSDFMPSGSKHIQQIAQEFKNACGQLQLEREKLEHFVNIILPQCPPVFYKWFLKSFPEPNQWLSSRTRYIKTLAVMSIVGYMIGLGDRHAENILFDQTNGDCVHVDLNMLFGKGVDLAVPEVVPFRLTHNLVDAMGILGYKGTFTKSCETTMNVMLQNKEALISVFQTLANSWTSHDKNKNSIQARLSSNKSSLAARSSAGESYLAARLPVDDPFSSEETFLAATEERFKCEVGETANKKVKDLILQATDQQNLANMFAGWAPFV